MELIPSRAPCLFHPFSSYVNRPNIPRRLRNRLCFAVLRVSFIWEKQTIVFGITSILLRRSCLANSVVTDVSYQLNDFSHEFSTLSWFLLFSKSNYYVDLISNTYAFFKQCNPKYICDISTIRYYGISDFRLCRVDYAINTIKDRSK